MMEGVPARTVQASPDAWQRVADRAYRRRADLNLTAADVVERSGKEVSLKLVSYIENARQTSYLDKKLRSLSRALWGTDDAIDLILKGDEPVLVEDEPAVEEVGLAAQVADLRRQFSDFVAKWEPYLHHLKGETDLQLAEWQVRLEEIGAGLRKPAQSGEAMEEAPRRERRGA